MVKVRGRQEVRKAMRRLTMRAMTAGGSLLLERVYGVDTVTAGLTVVSPS